MNRGEIFRRLRNVAVGYVRPRMGAGLRSVEASDDLVQSSLREVLADLENRDFDDAAQLHAWVSSRSTASWSTGRGSTRGASATPGVA